MARYRFFRFKNYDGFSSLEYFSDYVARKGYDDFVKWKMDELWKKIDEKNEKYRYKHFAVVYVNVDDKSDFGVVDTWRLPPPSRDDIGRLI